MALSARGPEFIERKLAAFERLRPEFEASFKFMQEVHGQRRFDAFPVGSTVRYIHALWICECKDHLLSIPRTIRRYEGQRCLELLRDWQEGATADVVEFLSNRLDMLPLGTITRQVEQARGQQREEGLLKRLEHGRAVMLNRGINLMRALDAIFTLADEDLLREVRVACAQYGHHPSQIERQLAENESELYAYVPHQLLAQENIQVMNRVGIDVMSRPTDQPGERTERVMEPTLPAAPYAEQVIEGYQELTSPTHNNLREHRFVDRPETSEAGQV